jgi:hypothetical protein
MTTFIPFARSVRLAIALDRGLYWILNFAWRHQAQSPRSALVRSVEVHKRNYWRLPGRNRSVSSLTQAECLPMRQGLGKESEMTRVTRLGENSQGGEKSRDKIAIQIALIIITLIMRMPLQLDISWQRRQIENRRKAPRRAPLLPERDQRFLCSKRRSAGIADILIY